MNIPIYKTEEITSRKTDFDMTQVYKMPQIERTIFQYASRDRCLKEIINYEDKKISSQYNTIHPKESLSEAKDLLRCFAKNLKFEPICNTPFNNARECLFRSRLKLRFCKNELDLFEECYNNPIEYAKFEELGTDVQLDVKHYFNNIVHKDFLL